jgi:CubicO group peptidase (beta-lactamase class C family)
MVQCLLFVSLGLRKEIIMLLVTIRPLFLLLLLASLIFSPSLAQDEEDPISRIDAVLRNAVENDSFSGAVLVARDGEILLSEGYGYAVREWDVPNTSDSVFYIGSITKQFTAMAILMLQERGLLTVQDPICNYLDECPDTWADITIYHLLNHTSGVPEHANIPNFATLMSHQTRPQEILDWFIDRPLDFVPGESWSYSNSGYILLGLILEKVSDESYQNFLRENIFEPLGMEHTGYGSNSRVIEHMTQGYSSAFIRAQYIHMSVPYAAGALYSTVGDLYLWNQALYSGQVVSQETWDAMLEAAYPVEGEDTDYAYGLAIGTLAGSPYIGHGGAIPGFSSVIAHLTEQNIDIIVLANLESNPIIYAETIAGLLTN